MSTIIPYVEQYLYPYISIAQDPSPGTQKANHTNFCFYLRLLVIKFLLSSLEWCFQKLGLYIIKLLLF
jgi:hypothetical protein